MSDQERTTTDTTAEPRPPQITAAIVTAMRAVRAVGKAGYNTDQKFKYRKYDDILSAANTALIEAGVAILPNVVNMERTSREVTTKHGARRTVTTTIVTVDYKLSCAADGSSETLRFYGEASDYGDKSLGKALSYAEKMMLIEVLKIPVDDPDQDPDSHAYDDDTPITDQGKPAPRQRGTRGRKDTKRGRGNTTAAPPPAAPAESDGATIDALTDALAPFTKDPIAAGGTPVLSRIWGDVERARLSGNLTPGDYNTMSQHVKLIKDEIEQLEQADRDAAVQRRPTAADPDPWATAPAMQWNPATNSNEPVQPTSDRAAADAPA